MDGAYSFFEHATRLFSTSAAPDPAHWAALSENPNRLRSAFEFLDSQDMSHWLYAHEQNMGMPLVGLTGEQRRRARARYFAHAEKNLTLITETLNVLRDAGADCLLLKGADLALTVYADQALRPLTDADILVRPEDGDRWNRAAQKHGFELTRDFQNLYPLYLKRLPGQFLFIEAHTELTQKGRFDLPPASLWAHAEPAGLPNVDIHVLSPLHRILSLLINLAHDRFDAPFFKFVELHWLLERWLTVHPSHLDSLETALRESGLENVFYYAATVVRLHLKSSLSEQWVDQFTPPALEKLFLDGWINPCHFPPAEARADSKPDRWRVNLALMSGWARRFSFGCDFLTGRVPTSDLEK